MVFYESLLQHYPDVIHEFCDKMLCDESFGRTVAIYYSQHSFCSLHKSCIEILLSPIFHLNKLLSMVNKLLEVKHFIKNENLLHLKESIYRTSNISREIDQLLLFYSLVNKFICPLYLHVCFLYGSHNFFV